MVDPAEPKRPLLDMANIFRNHFYAYSEKSRVSLRQYQIAQRIMNCRTEVLGGHVDRCDGCGVEQNSYNSCRDRHCPKCQGPERRKWLAAREAELLPVNYFHVVFTLPEVINALALQNKKIVYDILFDTSGGALTKIGADPRHLGAELGYIGILHTWGQNLDLHPHVHYVVPGGGLSPDGTRWIATKKRFLLSVRVLSQRFRTLFTDALQEAYYSEKLEFHGSLKHLADPKRFSVLLQGIRAKEWVVHSQPPFGGPEQTLRYLARYTHRVAISNHRLRAITDQYVTFEWKDYRRGQSHLLMTLHAHEFMRRFLLHVLPTGFVRIRYGGFLANRQRTAKLALCREILQQTAPQPTPRPSPTPAPASENEVKSAIDGIAIPATRSSDRICTTCKLGHMRITSRIPSLLPSRPRQTLRTRKRRRRFRFAPTWLHPNMAVCA